MLAGRWSQEAAAKLNFGLLSGRAAVGFGDVLCLQRRSIQPAISVRIMRMGEAVARSYPDSPMGSFQTFASAICAGEHRASH